LVLSTYDRVAFIDQTASCPFLAFVSCSVYILIYNFLLLLF
jgi:hypothetical protein